MSLLAARATVSTPAPRLRRPPMSRRRLIAGLLLVSLGLVELGYIAWMYIGTSILSAHHQQQTLSQLHRAWESGRDSVGTQWGTAEAIVEIPRFGPNYRVPVLEGTGADVLADGFGHMTGTAEAGQAGNYVIAAHRVTHAEPLRRMPELRPGDQVRILTRRRTYVYRLVTGGADLVVPLSTAWVTTPLPHNPAGGVEPPQVPGEHLLTMVTCAELFHTDLRMVVFGVLDHVEKTPSSLR